MAARVPVLATHIYLKESIHLSLWAGDHNGPPNPSTPHSPLRIIWLAYCLSLLFMLALPVWRDELFRSVPVPLPGWQTRNAADRLRGSGETRTG